MDLCPVLLTMKITSLLLIKTPHLHTPIWRPLLRWPLPSGMQLHRQFPISYSWPMGQNTQTHSQMEVPRDPCFPSCQPIRPRNTEGEGEQSECVVDGCPGLTGAHSRQRSPLRIIDPDDTLAKSTGPHVLWASPQAPGNLWGSCPGSGRLEGSRDGWYYRLSPSVLLKLICWCSNSQRDGIWVWGPWEVIRVRLGHGDGTPWWE